MKFSDLRNAAEFNQRQATRFFRRHSDAQVVFDVHRQMAFQLLGEFALALLAMEYTKEPHQRAA
jgi:hypothetical protein